MTVTGINVALFIKKLGHSDLFADDAFFHFPFILLKVIGWRSFFCSANMTF